MIDAAAARHVERGLDRHRRGVAEVKPLERFGDDDCRFAVRREIHVVRIVDRDRLAGFAGARIDRREAADLRILGIVGDPQRAHVPRRHHVLRVEAHAELVDHRQRVLVDDIDVVRLQVGHVDAPGVAGDRGAHLRRGDLAVQIGRIDDRRHSGNRGHRGRRDERRSRTFRGDHGGGYHKTNEGENEKALPALQGHEDSRRDIVEGEVTAPRISAVGR